MKSENPIDYNFMKVDFYFSNDPKTIVWMSKNDYFDHWYNSISWNDNISYICDLLFHLCIKSFFIYCFS